MEVFRFWMMCCFINVSMSSSFGLSNNSNIDAEKKIYFNNIRAPRIDERITPISLRREYSFVLCMW